MSSYTVNHTVDVDSVLAYIRANPAAFRAQLRAISLGIDTEDAIDGPIIMPYTTTLSRDNADIGHEDAIIGKL